MALMSLNSVSMRVQNAGNELGGQEVTGSDHGEEVDGAGGVQDEEVDGCGRGVGRIGGAWMAEEYRAWPAVVVNYFSEETKSVTHSTLGKYWKVNKIVLDGAKTTVP
ncbi:hypothetical protein FQA39_LY09362 [Lamprigera yunnana]|nr:hypothetical protein FQA39_LY09362 [Lamprigera yunnana]